MPPLNPLRVFEVAARLGSFSKAAEELRVTQSAVSRQISILEGHFGLQLFKREQQGVILTPVGASYHCEIGPALAAISAATEHVSQTRKIRPLRLRVYNSFAQLWLIPRLPEFHARHGGIRVAISNIVAPVNFSRDDVDLAIQFGPGVAPDQQGELLLRDLIQPVCSPKLLHTHALHSIADLAHLPVITSRYRLADWPDWLAAFGATSHSVSGPELPSSVLAYQAAKEGMGVAMGQVALLQTDFAAKTLVPLFTALQRPLGYYVVWRRQDELNREARAFLGWLRTAVAENLASTPL